MPDRSITLWSWLFPITYVIHITEEFYGGEGYSAYLKRLRGVDMSPTKFLVGQAIGLALIVVGILIARRLNFPQQLLVILGTVVLVNGLSHLGTSLFYREYGPGLVSGVLIWIPFGVATLVRFKSRALADTALYWIIRGNRSRDESLKIDHHRGTRLVRSGRRSRSGSRRNIKTIASRGSLTDSGSWFLLTAAD